MKIRKTRFPAFTQVFYDKHRKLRCYFRRAGVRVPLPEPHFGDAFWRVYNECLSGIEQPPQTRAAIGPRVRSGSMAAMVKRFTGSQTFGRLAISTQAKYRRTLAPLAECLDPIAHAAQPKHLKAWIAEKVDFPGAARDRFKAVRALFAYLVDAGEIEENPTLGIKPPRQRNVGARPWTVDEVEQARQYHALGTMARLAIEIGVGTGLRRSDLVRVGPQHVRDGIIRILQAKTKHPVAIPLGDELVEALAAIPPANDLQPFLRTDTGRPFTGPTFSVYLRRWCTKAGLSRDLSAHGMRKMIAGEMAENECTENEQAAVLGHQSPHETARYTKGANQVRLAQSAISKLSNRRNRV